MFAFCSTFLHAFSNSFFLTFFLTFLVAVIYEGSFNAYGIPKLVVGSEFGIRETGNLQCLIREKVVTFRMVKLKLLFIPLPVPSWHRSVY